jgi:serine/threonine protein kinase
MGQKIGRFEILRELGRGMQSIVYLAYDPRLQREIAIKTMHFATPDEKQNKMLLEEARAVGRLSHKNIVPVFEADEEEGDLYLVFEYVAGRSLGEVLHGEGAMPPVKAATLIRDVLDAIDCAHESGVVHRDLKPSNILIDDAGVPRVMDFGIAARIDTGDAGNTGTLTGTPAYMSPEYVTERRVSIQNDIFAAGLILYELLTGHRFFSGNDLAQIMKRVAQEDVRFPPDVGLDERLISIVYKATARKREQRYQDAGQFIAALDAYLNPEAELVPTDGKQSTLDFLLRRMRHKTDFPALSESVTSINKITSSEKESINQLSNAILKDFALTNKILRLVNSAFYRQAGGGNISTVSRAVIVLGFDAVRNIAITVLLFEHLQNKSNANQLKDEFLRANLAGILGKDISGRTGTRDHEQAFICSMFYNLGRLLCQFYFPEETEEIKKVMLQKNASEEAASIQVLGLSYEELGLGVARTWGFPPLMVNSMRKLPVGPIRKPTSAEERLRLLAAYSNELCLMVAHMSPDKRSFELRKVVARFGDALEINERETQRALDQSFEQLAEFSRVIHLNLQQTGFGRQVRAWAGDVLASTEKTVGTNGETIPGTILNELPAAAHSDESNEAGRAYDSEAAQAVLTAGIQDISNTLVEDFKLNDILRMILETMYRGIGFKRVILCIKDGRTNFMQGRFGLGPDTTEVSRQFRFKIDFTPDIFHAALSNGVDILISDTSDPKIAPRIPEWFRKVLTSETFVLFPLVIKNNPVALIYADKDKAGDIAISEKELSLLRTLRNQALLAIKQSM